MWLTVPTLLAIILLLIGYSAFFSLSETAFFSLSRVDLHRLRHDNSYGARRLVRLLQHPRETLIGILLGNELTNNAIGVAMAAACAEVIRDPLIASIASVIIITPIVLVFGELLPKNVAIGLAARISPWVAIPMTHFLTLTAPIRWILTKIADAGVRLFGGDPKDVRELIIEEEFRSMVDLGAASGHISGSERELIHGVFAFGDLKVEQVMTPAERMFRLPLTWPYERILEEVRAAQFSRIPVYHDNPDDVVGLLYVRDLIALQRAKERGQVRELEQLVRPVLFVTPGMPLEEVLREFQRTTVHLAVVTAPDGKQVLGLITMDDVLDALIGKA